MSANWGREQQFSKTTVLDRQWNVAQEWNLDEMHCLWFHFGPEKPKLCDLYVHTVSILDWQPHLLLDVILKLSRNVQLKSSLYSICILVDYLKIVVHYWLQIT